MRKILSVMFSMVALLALVFGVMPGDTSASSHREAPFTASNPEADATDLYAFVSPDSPDTVTLIANYVPLQVPAAGPNYYQFGDDVLYEINIDNNGDAQDDITFQFDFDSVIINGNTFLYNTGTIESLNDENLNRRQYYTVSVLNQQQSRHPGRQGRLIAGEGQTLQVAPYNVGPVSYSNRSYEEVAREAIFTVPLGGGGEYNNQQMKVFAGPRDDPFFVDLGGTFDLLQGITGNDHLAGFNVHSIAIQVPRSYLQGSNDSIIGVRTTAYRRMMTVLRPGFGEPGMQDDMPSDSRGPWVQISRLDNPLVNEVVIPLKDKNRFNASRPTNDTQFLSYVQNPELAGLLNGILGVPVPDAPRNDLVAVFLTGVEGLNQPTNVVPSSQLRLNMAIAPSAEANRLGVLGGDLAGFPNGRRLSDDVVDIELQAVAGELVGMPNDLGDNVNMNDREFMGRFPYLATPHDYRVMNAGCLGNSRPECRTQAQP